MLRYKFIIHCINF